MHRHPSHRRYFRKVESPFLLRVITFVIMACVFSIVGYQIIIFLGSPPSADCQNGMVNTGSLPEQQNGSQTLCR